MFSPSYSWFPWQFSWVNDSLKKTIIKKLLRRGSRPPCTGIPRSSNISNVPAKQFFFLSNESKQNIIIHTGTYPELLRLVLSYLFYRVSSIMFYYFSNFTFVMEVSLHNWWPIKIIIWFFIHFHLERWF